MKHYLYPLLAVGMLISVSLHSQNLLDPEVWKDYNPSTPEVGKLIEHKEIPIDYTRGVANISIPLYVIESGGVSVPITLNYSNKGIRPSEQSFALGLGWSLTAEPKIVRQINGHPDYYMTYMITTIFGLIVALILQVFYNYVLAKIEALTSEMEDSSISLLDMVIKYNLKYKK